MPAARLPKYVFRGTTKDYPGGGNSIRMPYTCTSSHPVKALWFALECYQENPEDAGIYLALTENLKHISHGQNHFHKLENEIGFFIQPISFYTLCEGFIYLSDFQKVLTDLGIDAYNIVRKDNLTELCKSTPDLSSRNIESLVVGLRVYLKK